MPGVMAVCLGEGEDPLRELVQSTEAKRDFTLSKPWLKEFTREYAAEVGLPFECSPEAHLADEETFVSLLNAGCFHVYVGVATGNETLRNEVLNQKVTNDELGRVFQWARKYGIRATAHSMIGIPYETESTIRESVDRARRLRPDGFSTTIFFPYPGTALRDLCQREGWMSRRCAASYTYGSILDRPSISHVAVERYRLLFPRWIRSGVLYRLCQWSPVAFSLGNILRYLHRLKRTLEAIRSAPVAAPRVAGRTGV